MTPFRTTLTLLLLAGVLMMAAGCVGDEPLPAEATPSYTPEMPMTTHGTHKISYATPSAFLPAMNADGFFQTPVAAPSPTRRLYLDSEVLVKYNSSLSNRSFIRISNALNREIGGSSIDASVHGMPYVQLIQLPPDISVDAAVEFYEKNESVEYAQPNIIYYLV